MKTLTVIFTDVSFFVIDGDNRLLARSQIRLLAAPRLSVCPSVRIDFHEIWFSGILSRQSNFIVAVKKSHASRPRKDFTPTPYTTRL
jgi:hypothetical protein